jgi:predicted nucleic acid-binding protein
LEETAKTEDPARRNIRVSGVCRDEPDHAILEAALACQAEFIVTGDRDLLGLVEFRRIRIRVSFLAVSAERASLWQFTPPTIVRKYKSRLKEMSKTV